MNRRDRIPVALGVVMGLAIAGYAFVYLPMSRNYAECGKITLCASSNPGESK